MLAIEPALRFTNANIVGGSMTYADESGDACAFTRKLAEKGAERGIDFQFDTTVVGIDTASGRVAGVQVRTPNGNYRRATADAYVVALGSYSAGWMRPLGIDLDIYPAKGYSATLPVRDPERAYTVSLTDDEYKLVFSRLDDRLRIAGTAELAGYDLTLNEKRCHALVRRTLEVFPDIADPAEAQFWTGLRPATPSNVPYIGRSKLKNLYLNTGHGTLGWTHSCGSGHVLADIVSGLRQRCRGLRPKRSSHGRCAFASMEPGRCVAPASRGRGHSAMEHRGYLGAATLTSSLGTLGVRGCSCSA
jgi:D-amino-acid dehydrogenase